MVESMSRCEQTPEGPSAHASAERPGVVAEFGEMVHELVHYRELLWQMVLRDLRLRYKQAVMGIGWAVFMPLMVVGAGLVVKYAMARVAGEPLQTAALAGMSLKALGWAFFVGALGFATNSLVSNIGLVTKIYFPREVFPLSAVVTQLIDSTIGSALLAVLMVGFWGLGLSWTFLWAVPLVGLLVLLTTGASLFLSCANVFFRDVKYLVQVILSFGIFFTPVFYEPQFFGPTGSTLMMLNPLSPLLEGLRLAVVEHHNLLVPLLLTSLGPDPAIVVWHPWYLAYAAAWAVFGCLGAWWLFHKLEFVYPEYI